MVARGPIVLRAAMSRQRLGKQVRVRSLHIRGAIRFVSFCGHMARGQGGPSALELVLSPPRIDFSIFSEDNPLVAVLA